MRTPRTSTLMSLGSMNGGKLAVTDLVAVVAAADPAATSLLPMADDDTVAAADLMSLVNLPQLFTMRPI